MLFDKKILFTAFVLIVFPLPQIAIDLYLPSLPAMTTYFHTTNFFLQLTLTVYIISLGITQLIYGPLSDGVGRKPILLIGVVIFFIGSIGCILSKSIYILLFFRVIQGIGMGCGFVVGSAILGDTFSGRRLAKMITFSSMVYSLSPILAPVLGGYFQYYSGWKPSFIFMAVFDFILLIGALLFIPETHVKNKNNPVGIKKIMMDYRLMMANAKFMGYVTCTIFCFGIVVVFNIVAPFLLQNVLNVSVMHYGEFLFLVGLSYFVGTLINSQLLSRIRVSHAIQFGILWMIVFALLMLMLARVNRFFVTGIVGLTCLEIFGLGFVFPNCFSKALEVFPDKLGTASAVVGAAGLVGGSMISIITAHISVHGPLSLGMIYLAESLLCLSSYVLTCFSSHENTRHREGVK